MNPFAPERREPARNAWFKTIDRMPDDPRVHQYLLAYASDYALVTTSLYPHGHSYWEPEMQVASLDHAMWFHRDFRMDDWLLYAMQARTPQGPGPRLRQDLHARGGARGLGVPGGSDPLPRTEELI